MFWHTNFYLFFPRSSTFEVLEMGLPMTCGVPADAIADLGRTFKYGADSMEQREKRQIQRDIEQTRFVDLLQFEYLSIDSSIVPRNFLRP